MANEPSPLLSDAVIDLWRWAAARHPDWSFRTRRRFAQAFVERAREDFGWLFDLICSHDRDFLMLTEWLERYTPDGCEPHNIKTALGTIPGEMGWRGFADAVKSGAELVKPQDMTAMNASITWTAGWNKLVDQILHPKKASRANMVRKRRNDDKNDLGAFHDQDTGFALA